MGEEIDATADKHLRGKYALVGVGETAYVRGSGCTTRTLATRAVRAAIEDAGLTCGDVDGMLSYSNNDSTFSTFVAGDLGIRLRKAIEDLEINQVETPCSKKIDLG